MINIKCFMLIIMFVFFACSIVAQNKRTECNKDAIFCEILKKPKKYEKEKLRFFATYKDVFGTGTFLTSSDCKGKLMQVRISEENQSDFLQMKENITKNLIEDKDGLSKKVRLGISGYLEKDSGEYIRPVKDLLQNYTLVITSITVGD